MSPKIDHMILQENIVVSFLTLTHYHPPSLNHPKSLVVVSFLTLTHYNQNPNQSLNHPRKIQNQSLNPRKLVAVSFRTLTQLQTQPLNIIVSKKNIKSRSEDR
eukprot:UN11567